MIDAKHDGTVKFELYQDDFLVCEIVQVDIELVSGKLKVCNHLYSKVQFKDLKIV